MKIKKMKFEKGTYRFQQIAGFVSVRDYMFVTAENKKHLLIRFFSDLPFAVDQLEYVITQIDEFGEPIINTRQVKSKITLHGGSEYVTQDAVEVSDRCTDVKIEIKEVRAENYAYTFENGVLKDRYLRNVGPIVEVKGRVTHYRNKNYLQIKEKRTFSVRKATWAAVIALVILMVGVVLAELLAEYIPIWATELKNIIIDWLEKIKELKELKEK